MTDTINQVAVVACVNEFYSTSDQNRRQELDRQLCQFKTSFPCDQTISACILLMGRTNPANVQYFGAISLYDTIRQRAEECIANPSLMDGLKRFLIDNLASSAHIQMQSITNKLSSALALLALYCIPDVWAQPVQDLTVQWAATPELLLRVLAEMAAEFSNVQMPLTQRSILKTELHRISEEIILIIRTVMGAVDASPSTRQAAVECVEQWLQLPGIGLHQWTEVLSVVFSAVSEDNAALTNLLNILAINDELSSLEQLVLDICRYITQVAAQKVAAELREEGDSDDVALLVTAVCSLAEKAVPTLIVYAKKKQSEYLVDICSMFATLSSWEGKFPVDEAVSDIPANFWTTLREELASGNNVSSVIEAVKPYFGSTCKSSITKLTFPSSSEFDRNFDSEQKERFIMYRVNMSEMPLNSFTIVGPEVLDFFNSELDAAIGQGDLCRIESILYHWELVADYLTMHNFAALVRCIQCCTRLVEIPRNPDSDRLGNTLMRLLFGLSHLIEAHTTELEAASINLVLGFLNRRSVVEEALKTLEKFVENKTESLTRVGDAVSERCYNLFMDCSYSQKCRLCALKCIGYTLTRKGPEATLEILNRLIAPYVKDLAKSNGPKTEQSIADQIFQISIFSCLFSSLRNTNNNEGGSESVVTVILRQAMPVFRTLLESQGPALNIGDKVCDAVRSAVGTVPSTSYGEVYPFACGLVDQALLTNAVASCSLAKSLVLNGSKSAIANDLCIAISRWFHLFEQNQNHKDIEEWLSLIYHVVKKDWTMLRKAGESALEALRSSINLAGNALASSSEPNVVRLASQVLATIATQTTSYADESPRELLARNGPPLVKMIFLRIQSELMRTTVEALSEVLFFFAKHFPIETRQVIEAEERGDSPMVAAMFREIGNLRNFKQMTLRLNQACRKAS